MNRLDRFGLTEDQLRSLVSEGLRNGGDWCDIYLEDTSYYDLMLRDGSVSAGGFHIDYGCGIRVLRGERTGYAYAESTDYRELISAARAAGSIAAGSGRISGSNRLDHFRSDSGALSVKDHYPIEKDWREAEAKNFIPFLERFEKGIKARDPRAEKVTAMLSYSISEIAMFNSFGELTCDRRPLGSLTVSIVFKQGDMIESRNVSRSLRMGVEMLTEEVLQDLVDRSVKGIDERFAARRPKGGQMPVVMAAGASGILLHEAMGHAFEADFNRKGQSIFTDKMGKRICRKGINILDDGTVPFNRGACNFDDEGIPGQKTYMVTDGVLTSYLHDRISAAWHGVPPTGNGRRESFRYNPIPRMRATYMENGSDGTLNDLIGSVRKGIFVDQFANGQVKIGEGDFTFYVKSGWLIEKGRLTMPVKDINIIGNGPQALADIEAVAGDLKIDESTWTCGKEQSVAVSCGIPSVLIKNLTVGGE